MVSKKVKQKINDIPLLGAIAFKAYQAYNNYKPNTGNYWIYRHRPKIIARSIDELLKYSLHRYSLKINSDGSVYVILLNCLKFWWTPNDSKRLMGMPLMGFFEEDETFLVERLVKEGNTVLDIGANFGWYTIHMGNLVGTRGKVHSFEPTYTVDELKANVILNGYQSRTEINQLALSDKDGTNQLTIPSSGTVFASLRKPASKTDKTIIVRTRTLDRYIREENIQHIDFIKIDVEGAELLVFQGGKKMLTDFNPTILIEADLKHTKNFNYTPTELFRYFSFFGYEAYEIIGKGVIRRPEDIKYSNNYNFLLMKDPEYAKSQGIKVI
jgi:FkbM family methyltransferase